MFLFTNGKVPGQTSLALGRLKSGPKALSRLKKKKKPKQEAGKK